jgi:predicted deacetylase
MNWAIWDQIEQTLDEVGVKPLVGVVPDNIDPELRCEAPRGDFWLRARAWRDKGWTIAVHGYQHFYETRDSGLLKLNRRSEFAGLGYATQLAKLTRAVAILNGEGLQPTVWTAPSHSFDSHTIAALYELGVGIISDGLSRWPYQEPNGMLWIPQQIWRLRVVPAGMWTACYHHNRWSQQELTRFREDVNQYRTKIVSFSEIPGLFRNRRRTLGDRIFPIALRIVIQGVAAIRRSPIDNSKCTQ